MPGLLPQSDIDAMRATVNSSLDLTCVIQRKTSPTRTAEGYQVDNYGTIATTVCILTQPPQSMLTNNAGLIGTNEAWLVRLPWNADIRADDQVLVSGQTMHIQVVLNPQSYSMDTRCLATQLRGGAV